ncbi:toxin glutamine deamidase domain-containing protein [Cryptosporangium minutisporangium]|uniref:Tox-PL domain-containing protein n=1 Tax=Cryptosporangium minutisporangium TaxID=113569 RepID=A0ABP6SW45_9ACTN
MAVWKPDFGEYDYVWDFICGVSAGNPWPRGNEDDLWVLAAEWAEVAQALNDAIQDAGPVVNDLVAAWGGDSGYAFLGLWETLGQSPEAGLSAVAEMASSLSTVSDNAAMELQYNKLTTLITVIITIISVFTALVAAFFTGGGSAATIQPIMLGGRAAVQQSFLQLLKNLARKGVERELRKELLKKAAKDALKKAATKEGLRKLGKEAAEELAEELIEEVVLVDGLAQVIQMVSGRRASWDVSKTAASAIGATVGVPIGMGVAPAVQWAKHRVGRGVTSRLSEASIERINRGIERVNSPSTRLEGLGKQLAATPGQALTTGLVNSVTSPTSSWIANGLVYGNWEYPVGSMMDSALAGASRANTISPPQLAAATLTGGSTGFRETLLGSHPAAVSFDSSTPVSIAPVGPIDPVSVTTGAPLAPTEAAPPSAVASPGLPEAVTPAGAAPAVPGQPESAPVGPGLDPPQSVTTAPAATAPTTAISAALAPTSFADPTTAPASPLMADIGPSTTTFPPDPTAPPTAGTLPVEINGTQSIAAATEEVGRTPSVAASIVPPTSTAGSSTTTPPQAGVPLVSDKGTIAGPPMSSAPKQLSTSVGPMPIAGAADSLAAQSKETSTAPVPATKTQGDIESFPARADSSPVTVTRGALSLPIGPSPERAAVTAPVEADKVPAAPARAPSASSGSTSPDGTQLPPPLLTSKGPTANGASAYDSPLTKVDSDSDLTRHAIEAARALADRVATEVQVQRWSLRRQNNRLVSAAGALITSNGVVRSHTSMRGGGKQSPAFHPDMRNLLRSIRSDLYASGVSPRVWHGQCAEVALLSDFLYDFDKTYIGPSDGFLDAAREVLTGAKLAVVEISLAGTHSTSMEPCRTCSKLLEVFNIEHVDAGASPRGGAPPPVPSPSHISETPGSADGRPTGEPGGLDIPDPADQDALERAVPIGVDGRPMRFPNPLGRWLGLVNDGGPDATPFRANNCLDTGLSFLGTWLGNPQVSAPRTREFTAAGEPSTAGEANGRVRAEETLGATFQHRGSVSGPAYSAIADQLRTVGHGSSALIITSTAADHGGGSHAWNAVNHNGTIHWIDAQLGTVSTEPLYDDTVDGVWSIVLDPTGQPVRPGEPPAAARGVASPVVEEQTGPHGGSPTMPAAQSVARTSFVPNGRGGHLPDLVPGEFLAAAAQVRPQDFGTGLVSAIDVGADAVTVRLTDGRLERFEVRIGADLPDLATTVVDIDRSVVTVGARVAPDQLARVWVHEIATTLQAQQAATGPMAMGGFFDRARQHGTVLTGRPIARRVAVDPLLEARLSERRYLIRALTNAASVTAFHVLAEELSDLDQHLASVGVAVQNLPSPPAEPPGLPYLSEADYAWAEPWSDGLDADPTPPWLLEGRPPLLDDLVPRSALDGRRLHDATASAVESRLVGPRYAGFGVQLSHVETGPDYLNVRLDVVDSVGRRVGIAHFTVGRDAAGQLYAQLDRIRMNENVRGAGFATEFTRSLERWYAESGVTRIELRAVDAGAYAWARASFYWASPAAAEPVFRRLHAERDRAASQADLVRRWFARQPVPQAELEAVAAAYPGVEPSVVLADLDWQRGVADQLLYRAETSWFGTPGYPSPNEIALAGRSGLGRSWVGRRTLIGADWQGVRWLSAPTTPAAPAGSASSGASPLRPAEMMQSVSPAAVGSRAATWADLGFASADDVPEKDRMAVQRALPFTRMVNPTDIAFTQRSIGKRTNDQKTIDELATAIGRGWHGGPLHGVLWADGSLVSLDNRRLTAARRIGKGEVPFVPHAPGELLEDWPEDWPLERREFARLLADIRELPDGNWVVGGEQGKVVYAAGEMPNTFGELALFRAAMGRDLLPGNLFGSTTLPITVTSPKKSAKPKIAQDVRAKIDAAIDAAARSAPAIATDLVEISADVNEELGLDAVELASPSWRIRDRDALALEHLDADRYLASGEAPESDGEILRLSVQLPADESYLAATLLLLNLLEGRGYAVDRVLDLWQAGNLHQELVVVLRSAHHDQPFELALATYRSLSSVRGIAELDRILQEPNEAVARKIPALLRLIWIQKSTAISRDMLGLAEPPPALASSWSIVDDSLARWLSKHPKLLADYAKWLTSQGLDIGDVVAEFGLDEQDLPVRPAVLEELTADDAGVLRALQAQHLGPAGGGDRSARDSDVRRALVGPHGEGLELRSGGGSSNPLQPEELRSVPPSGPGGGGADYTGDHGVGTAPGRGDDPLAVPVEGRTTGAGSLVEAPSSDNDSAWQGPAGPFARSTPSPPLNETRSIRKRRLQPLEDPSYQAAVRQALASPDGHIIGADPRWHPYGALINDGGVERPDRDNNCLDCSLAALSSFYGRPEVSLPRWADEVPAGENPQGELRGINRAMWWLGAETWLNHDDLSDMADRFWALHDNVAALGPGSAALVANVWQAADNDGNLLFDEHNEPLYGDAHATVVVYPLDADGPVWWDPQDGSTSDGPPEWLVSDTIELSYITVELDGRVNGADGTVGHAGSGTGLPGSRVPSRDGVDHGPLRVRVGDQADPGDGGADQASPGAGAVDVGAEREHRADHRARTVPPSGGHPAVPGGDRGGTRAGGSPDLSEAATGGPETQRGDARADAVGRVDEDLLLPQPLSGHGEAGFGRHRAGERAAGTPVDDVGAAGEDLALRPDHLPGAGPIPGDTPTGGPERDGAVPADPDGGDAAQRSGIPRPLPPEHHGEVTAPEVSAHPEAVRAAVAAHDLTSPADVAIVASAYDVALRWTAPYLIAAVDQTLVQLTPQATGDRRFLFVTGDDTVPWIVGRLAPDFARRHALWVHWPPTPTGWQHLRTQDPATVVTDIPAGLPTARPLLPPTPGGSLVSRIHGPASAGPFSAEVVDAVRTVARAAVVEAVRAAMDAGPRAGRAAVYRVAAQLDRHAAGEPPDPAEAALTWWLGRPEL